MILQHTIIFRKDPVFLGTTQAIFTDWDASFSSTIRIRSKNSKGSSALSSEIKVPILTNAENQQPTNLQYNDEKYIFTWDPPSDHDNLIGYTVFWCIDSGTSLPICLEQQNKHMETINSSQHQFQFWNSMHSSNLAVAARYSHKIRGGMRWMGYRWTQTNPKVAGFSYYVAPIVVSTLIILSIGFYRRYRACQRIEVILPEGLELDRDKTPLIPARVTIPGYISPEIVMPIYHLMPKKDMKIENKPQDRRNSTNNTIINQDSQDNTDATVTYTTCPVKSIQIETSIATGSCSTLPVKPSIVQNIPHEIPEFPKKQ